MKRLLRKSKKHKFNIGDKVRVSGEKDNFYKIIDYDKDLDEYILVNNQQREIDGIVERDIKGKHDFFEGDEVSFYTDPFEKKKKFIVKDVLNDGKYLIESQDSTYTNIHGKNLILYSDM